MRFLWGRSDYLLAGKDHLTGLKMRVNQLTDQARIDDAVKPRSLTAQSDCAIKSIDLIDVSRERFFPTVKHWFYESDQNDKYILKCNKIFLKYLKYILKKV